MLVKAIEFSITDFNTGLSEEFIIPDTIENEDRVMAHRNTRCIQYVQMFDFEFEKKWTTPVEFISMSTWMRLSAAKPYLFENLDGERCSECEYLIEQCTCGRDRV